MPEQNQLCSGGPSPPGKLCQRLNWGGGGMGQELNLILGDKVASARLRKRGWPCEDNVGNFAWNPGDKRLTLTSCQGPYHAETPASSNSKVFCISKLL